MNVPGEPQLSPWSLLRALLLVRRPWPGQHASTFRLGRDALAAACSALGPVELLVPAFICAEAVQGLRSDRSRIRYYPVGPDLQPDWATLGGLLADRDRVADGRGAAVLVVHYFGFRADVVQARRLCERYGAALIEDCAHLPFIPETAKDTASGASAVYSFRKQYAVWSGAALVRGSGDGPSVPTARGGLGVGGVMKELASWSMFTTRSRLLRERFAATLSDERGLSASRQPWRKCEWLAGRIVASESSARRAARMVKARRANYEVLIDVLSGTDGVAPLFGTLPADAIPWGLPVRVTGGATTRDDLLAALLHEGIGAWAWPELPADVPAREFAFEARLADELLLLPVHQGLTRKHMTYVADTVNAWALGRD